MESEKQTSNIRNKGPQSWFSADLLHLGHWNIGKYCNRPFSSVQEMDDTIIRRINEKVDEKDTFFMLGDFAFSKDRKHWFDVWKEYRSRINCRNVELICGNHDPHCEDYTPKQELMKLFSKVLQARMVRISRHTPLMPWETGLPHDRQIYLHHYACRTWPHSHHGSFMFYGHSHGSLPDDPHALSLDVGVDAIAKKLAIDGQLLPENYRPVNMNEIATWMSQKQYVPPFSRD